MSISEATVVKPDLRVAPFAIMSDAIDTAFPGHVKQTTALTQAPLERLDTALVARGLFESRSKAREAIEAGLVTIDGRVARKPAAAVGAETALSAAAPYAWVSRGGIKLAAGLDAFGLSPEGRVCLDLGASTGGFTDVLLSRGASRVYAVDVGRGQLHARIASDPRVANWSGTDIRSVATGQFHPKPDLIVCDVSFISLELVVPPALALAAPACDLLALIKPQFEVGPNRTVRGIVRDEALRSAACRRIADMLTSRGMVVRELVSSPITGADGNVEYLIAARRP